jgi:hypothetical protein
MDELDHTPSIPTVPIDVVSHYVSLRKSKLVRVFIDHKLVPVSTYKEVLFGIYNTIGRQILINRTLLNISLDVCNDMGYTYYSELGLSIQDADELRIVNEIFEWMRFRKQTLELFVELRNGETIKIVK